QVRPWIVLVENSDKADDTLFKDKGYDFVYFDGLNRFYLSKAHIELAAVFSAPPNLFDDFTLSGKASSGFCSLLNSRIEKIELELQKLLESKAEYEKMLGKLSNRLLERNKKWAARLAGTLSTEKASLPESASLNPRAQMIYAKLIQAMEGKVR
ncbi:MAG TPA: hypothetical protein PLK99_06845, partial [Burkholderiales bacterium]|nr:hypothetical protein [Burkholderiales bacterium]